MQLDYVDLYLIHNPRLALPNIKESWQEMEKLKKAGKARCVFLAFLAGVRALIVIAIWIIRSIGVSNYQISHLTTLLETAEIVPAVNQVSRCALWVFGPARVWFRCGC